MIIPFTQTPNYQKTTGIPKIGFILHGTLGSYTGSVSWLLNGDRPNPTSAHYVIGRNEGEVTQLVKNEDIAWHAGVISNPNQRAQAVLPKKSILLGGGFDNPNKYFIGIEFVWGFDMNNDGSVNPDEKTLTDWQYRCAIDIIRQSGIKYDPAYILSHKEITDYKADDMKFACDEIAKRMSINQTKDDIKTSIVQKISELNSLIAQL